MIEWLERITRERWDDLDLGPRPQRLAFLVDSEDRRPHGFARFRAFRDRDRTPLFRGKIPRDGVALRAALAEHDLLRTLAEEVPAEAGRLFPRPLFGESQGSLAATAETMPGGHPAQGAGPVLAAGERWLVAFRRATGMDTAAEAALREPYLRAALACAATLPPGEARARLERFAEDWERRDGRSRCAIGHGALCADRLRLRADGVAAEDWEAGERRAPWWSDPVALALDVALRETTPRAWTEGACVDAFLAGFLSESPLARSVRAFLAVTLEGCSPEEFARAVPAVAILAARRAERSLAPSDTWAWRAVARVALSPRTADLLAESLATPTAA